jgi:PAS domain S-box-containing protein
MSGASDRCDEPHGSVRDVTWEVLSEHIVDLVVLADTTGTIFYASPACRRLGYEQHELIGRSAADFVHPDDLAHFQTNSAALFGQGPMPSPADREHRFRRGDGSWVWLQGNPALLPGPEGRPAGLINIFRDVTETRAVREELEAGERRYRLLAENTTDMISRTACDGRHLYLSASVERMTGYTIAELMPRQMRDFVHPEDLDRFLKFYGRLVSGRSEGGQPIRHRVRHKDGSFIWLESNPRLVTSAIPGEPDAIVDVTRNVTDQQTLKDQLREALRAAEQAAAVKSEFLANMSHEIRTPLTAILGYAGLLGERRDLEAVAKGHADRISVAARGLLAIVNDVLDFSKLEAGQTAITPQPTDVAALAREVLEMFGFQAAEKRLALALHAAPGLPALVALDGGRLRQVLVNLVGNGVKFTEHGSVAVNLGYDTAAGRVVVEVVDTGPGIAAAAQARLFQRFSQVDGSSTRSKGGTGLGLAICRGLAEAMGGKISVASRVGQGAAFRLELPAPALDGVSAAAGGELDTLDGLRLLVVDDNAINRELVRAMLEPYGVEVSEACDGQEGVDFAADLPVDLILMDVRMPRMDGRAAAAAIRHGDGPNRDVPIIGFSAGCEEEARGVAPSGPFSAWIGKPVRPAELLDGLRQALDETAPIEQETRHVRA